MTKKAIMEAILNPSRQRIIQCVVYNQPCHVNLLSKALPDIPRPSLYRHIQILKDSGLLREETVKSDRGVPHRVYSFLDYSQAASAQDIAVLYYTALLNLLSSFEDYFQQPEPDPIQDLYSISSSELLLSDEEYLQLLGKIGHLIREQQNNAPSPHRRQRSLTMVSAPAMAEAE